MLKLRLFWQQYGAMLALGFVVFLWAFSVTFLFWSCPPDHPPQPYHGYWQRYEECGPFLSITTRLLTDIADWIGRNLEVIAVCFSAAATVAIAHFTRTLKQSTDKLWIATQSAAGDSKRAANIAEEALLKLERPFVFVSDFGTRARRDHDRPGHWWYTIHPVLENSGNTPTIDMTSVVEYSLRDERLPLGFTFTYCDPPGRTLIGPKGKIGTATGRILDTELAEVKAGTRHFYVWGRAEYRDMFNDTPMHVTTFCSEIGSVLGDPFDPVDSEGILIEIGFRIHREYNTAT